jgi:type I restriction enzyme, S subunit
MKRIDAVCLPRLGALQMGETIIEKDCKGEGLPIYSAEKGNRPWAYSDHFRRIYSRGTIVIGARGTIGYPRLPNDARFGATQTTITLTPNTDEFVPAFVCYALQNVDFELLGAQQAIPMLTLGNLQQVSIPRFPKPEQVKIAEVLSTVDRAIEQTEALIAKQQRIKTGLMQDLLTRGIDEEGNLRSPKTHNFVDSVCGPLPSDWSCTPFGDCWRTSPQNGLYKPQSHYSDDGTPIVRIDGFRNGDLITNQTFRRVRVAPIESRAFALGTGDLLINRVNSIEWLGKAALVGSLLEATVFESNMMRIRVDPQRMMPEFAILVLSSPHAYRHFLRCAKTAIAQASINQDDVRSLLFALPPRAEQERIVDGVQAAQRAEERLTGAAVKLCLLRTGLMQDLLTGDCRVNALLASQEEVVGA